MKKFLGIIALAVVVTFSTLMPAQAAVEVWSEATATTGWFQRDFYGDGAAIWTTPPSSKDGRYGIPLGKITKLTKVTVINIKGITADNLDLLDGKHVACYVEYRKFGRGEGVSEICDELTLIILD